MKALWYSVSALVVAACDSSPVGLGSRFLPGPWPLPSFALYPTPDGAVDGISCNLHEAYAFSDHFVDPLADSNRVKFYAEGVGERLQCGDLPFASQSAQAGDFADFSYILDTGGQWEYWARRMRRKSAPTVFDQDSMILDWIPKFVRISKTFQGATL